MTPTKGKEKNIFIRDLTPKDRKMLLALREEFKTSYNTVGVMKAAYGYIDQKKKLSSLSVEKQNLLTAREREHQQLEDLKFMVNDFFEAERNAEFEKDKKIKALLSVVKHKGKKK